MFRQLHSFLEEREQLLLDRIEEVEKVVETTRDQHLAKLSETLSSVDSLIQEMEEKCQKTVIDLLQTSPALLSPSHDTPDPIPPVSDLPEKMTAPCHS
uniref:Uncharacterized protein n=1 Tax=Sphaerodactylus townsendi TaxID=933632 RepID=A0ACB8EFR1_9SAUR